MCYNLKIEHSFNPLFMIYSLYIKLMSYFHHIAVCAIWKNGSPEAIWLICPSQYNIADWVDHTSCNSAHKTASPPHNFLYMQMNGTCQLKCKCADPRPSSSHPESGITFPTGTNRTTAKRVNHPHSKRHQPKIMNPNQWNPRPVKSAKSAVRAPAVESSEIPASRQQGKAIKVFGEMRRPALMSENSHSGFSQSASGLRWRRHAQIRNQHTTKPAPKNIPTGCVRRWLRANISPGCDIRKLSEAIIIRRSHATSIHLAAKNSIGTNALS